MAKARILVIRGGAIGDFILTLPAIKLLREAFPGAHLEILGYRHIIVLAEGRFYADAVRSIEYGAMASFFVPRSELPADLVEYFGSFQQVVSYLFDPDRFFENNVRRAGVKNFLPAFARIDDSEHAARQLARPLQSLALFLDDHAATVHLRPEDEQFATDFLAGAGESFVAIHPGSGSPKKNWPVSRWLELGERLRDSARSIRLVLVGGEADGPRLDELVAAWPDALIARDLPLPQLAAVLARCRLFLGHDSGISHLAAAAGTASILLFGPTDSSVWAPAHPHVEVIEAPAGRLLKLEVSAVLKQLARRL